MIVSQWVFIFSGPTSKMYQTLILINSLSIYFYKMEKFLDLILIRMEKLVNKILFVP